jgi:hypothetical protein
MRPRHGPINSPKASVLKPLSVGDALDVDVDVSGVRPVLVVRHAGQDAGSLTMVGYLDLIACILDRGIRYRAKITKISGGVYEVRVEPAP